MGVKVMTQTTILEKFKIVFEISKSSNLFIAVIAFIILFAIVALTTNKQNAKRGKKIYGLVYATILVAILIFYYDSLGQMFDYMMNNFFIAVYFPNVAIYLAALIIANIILYISIFNYKVSKLIKNINITVYCVLNYLLILIQLVGWIIVLVYLCTESVNVNNKYDEKVSEVVETNETKTEE